MMHKLFRSLSIVLTLILLPVAVAFAATGAEEKLQTDEGLEMLLFMDVPEVITATLTQQSIITAPSTISVITEEQIHQMGLRTLADALNKVPGITLKRSFFGEELIILRGIQPSTLSNDKFKFMIDGHTIAEPLYGFFENIFKYSLENVKQVEIIRGPGSSLYGTNAYTGVINIITKKPSEIDGTRIDAKIESFDTTRVDLATAKKEGDFGWKVTGSYLKTDGHEKDIERDVLFGTPISIAPGKMGTDFDRKNANLYLEWDKLNLTFNYVDNDQETPIPVTGFLTQNGENALWNYWDFVGKYEIDLSDTIKLRPTAHYDRMEHETKSQVIPNGFVIPLDIDGDGDIEFFPNGANANWGYKGYNLGADLVLDWKVSDNNQLLLGIFAEKMETNDTFLKSSIHPLFLFNLDSVVDVSATANWNEDADREIGGFFFQDEWNMNEDWNLILGGRYDDFSDFGITFNPRGGLVWDFNKKGGVVKFLYGSAFKAPTFTQLRNQNNPILLGNRDLDPETLDSFETTFSYIFGGKLQTNIALYSVETDKQIKPSPILSFGIPGTQYVNSDGVKSRGLELDAKYVFMEKSYLFGSYTYTDAEDKATGETSGLIPENTGTLGINVHFAERWNWNINAELIGEIPREVGDSRSDLDATATVDNTLRIENIRGFDIYFSVYNLFDEDVFSASNTLTEKFSDLPRAGRVYAAGATYKF